MSGLRLLAGPDLSRGPERLGAHVQRLGPLPSTGSALIEVIERSGLTGRGGAAFPVGVKWRSIARRRGEPPVIVVNGAEGEPQSLKDRVLMGTRPHLVLDGAMLAARALRTREVVVVVGEAHRAAYAAMAAAMAERPEPELRQARLVPAPARYVAGESSAAVQLVSVGIARPTTRPPSMHDAGVDGRPTLVQNVESLAHVALIARYGAEWFRSAGRGQGTVLVTAAGSVTAPGVVEVE
ncbi:MAG TPA: proton-conducting membrane transporter, partial [Candidatus Dormibacteraeota bacterium]|nr:proton-conducting membrane transporter [Candidatus Dormibacteraeota bacterium]